MPINPAVIQQLPGFEYKRGPSRGEAALSGFTAGVKGYGDYAAQQEKAKVNQMTAVGAAMISSGALQPDPKGDIEIAGVRWAANPEAFNFKKAKRGLELQELRADVGIKQGKQARGPYGSFAEDVVSEQLLYGDPAATSADIGATAAKGVAALKLLSGGDKNRPLALPPALRDKIKRAAKKKNPNAVITDEAIDKFVADNGIKAVRDMIGE